MDLSLYKTMLKIRVLEQELQKLCDIGEGADLHFSKGQEAISVGACAALRETDYLVTHHRTIAHAVAKGVPLEPLVAEILGKETGICGGRAGEMHLSYPQARMMFSFQLVGTCVPVAAGLAWAAQNYLKTDDIVVVFHGDAATGNAQWHEGLNIAAVKGVPLLLLCENNGLAGNIRTPYYLPTKTVTERASGYGIEAAMVDGNHVDEVFTAVKAAAERVRNESRPYLLEFSTTRLCWHKQGQRDVRSTEELAELAKRDPLLYEERRLRIPEEYKQKVFQAAQAEVMAAIAAAESAKLPVT